MKELTPYIPFLIPIVLFQWILIITALWNLYKNKKVKLLNIPLWIIIILFVNLIGPILYFILGRDDA